MSNKYRTIEVDEHGRSNIVAVNGDYEAEVGSYAEGLSQEDEVELYLPWPAFEGRAAGVIRPRPTAAALRLAAEHHPAWGRLKDTDRLLLGRTSHIVLGPDLTEPADVLICWTEDGVSDGRHTTQASGGTGQAVRVASAYRVPVFNLGAADGGERLEGWIREGVSR